MDELISVFIQEGREQLQAMENGLLLLEQNADDHDNINSIFRAAHTIKGSSGVIECHFIESFMHKVENALDRLRNGEINVSAELISLLLRCCDHLAILLDALAAGAATLPAATSQAGDILLNELSAYSAAEPQPAADHPQPGAASSADTGSPGSACWHISLRFAPHMLRGGMDPLSFIGFLATLGEIVALETLADTMPPAADMDPETCYLGFEIQFQSSASLAEIEAVFDFCRDDCQLRILAPDSKPSDFIALIQALPEDNQRLEDILLRFGVLSQAALADGPAPVQQQPDPTPSAALPGRPHPAGPSNQGGENKEAKARLIRVQADKLDMLIDLVGELVIAGASANLLAQRSGQGELVEATSVLSRLVEDIRNSALQLRMVQIGETFNRFNRVVRDVSHELDKEIDLVIRGAETELDKSVVEKIGDPLMHLVRNSMDHGIEAADLRVAAGKPRHGLVELNAYHDSGSIVIEVRDDGGGLPRDKILQKAVENGMIPPTQSSLTDQEIFNLIWEPGFSTAGQVTNLSGRGVGLDVVRRNIQALRGSCEVSSQDGKGTVFTIRLPLTLAIIDGFLVGVEQACYVIPLDSVIECVELKDEVAEHNFLNLRGEILPFLRLRELFDISGQHPARENVVVVKFAGHKAGIVVDQLLGEYQTVIKPLSTMFRNLRGIGGSTILGSGEVALILDVQALTQRIMQVAERKNSRTPSSISTS